MRTRLVPSLLVLFSGAALLLAACGESIGPRGPTFLVCEDQAQAISADTTIAGGTDHLLLLGRHSLVIPAAAIPDGESVRFELQQVPSTQVRVIVEVEPEQQFAADVVLTLSYQDRIGCTVGGVPVSEVTDLRVYKVETGEFLPFAPSVHDQATAGRTRSLSTFAIAT